MQILSSDFVAALEMPIFFEMQENRQFDSQDVKDAPFLWLRKAQQEKFKEGAPPPKLANVFFGQMEAIIVVTDALQKSGKLLE